MLRWRCHIKEYSPKIFYLEGKNNVLADAFSRLLRFDDPKDIEGKIAVQVRHHGFIVLHAFAAILEPPRYQLLDPVPEVGKSKS